MIWVINIVGSVSDWGRKNNRNAIWRELFQYHLPAFFMKTGVKSWYFLLLRVKNKCRQKNEYN